MALNLKDDYPHLNLFLQGVARPAAESLRATLYTGQGNLDTLIELMTLLGGEVAAGRGDEPVIDGRAAEGVRVRTAAQMLTGLQFMADLLAWSQASENVDRRTEALRLCVRPLLIRE